MFNVPRRVHAKSVIAGGNHKYMRLIYRPQTNPITLDLRREIIQSRHSLESKDFLKP